MAYTRGLLLEWDSKEQTTTMFWLTGTLCCYFAGNRLNIIILPSEKQTTQILLQQNLLSDPLLTIPH